MQLNINITRVALATAAWLLSPQPAWSFYNPQTGRWLNRDPLEEPAGVALYAFVKGDPQAHIDPDGRLTIQRFPHDHETGNCGAFDVRWSFSLDDPMSLFVDGYFVQKVTYSAQRNWCDFPNRAWPIRVYQPYWEAWRVGPLGRPVGSLTIGDDQFRFEGNVRAGATPASQGGWSWFNIAGELKFFPFTLTGDLDVAWPRLDQAGGLPSTHTPPSWWDDPPLEGPAYHFVYSRWDCCCGKHERPPNSDYWIFPE